MILHVKCHSNDVHIWGICDVTQPQHTEIWHPTRGANLIFAICYFLNWMKCFKNKCILHTWLSHNKTLSRTYEQAIHGKAFDCITKKRVIPPLQCGKESEKARVYGQWFMWLLQNSSYFLFTFITATKKLFKCTFCMWKCMCVCVCGGNAYVWSTIQSTF